MIVKSKFDFPPWYMTAPGIITLGGVAIIFGIAGARAWGYLSHYDAITLVMKIMPFIGISLVLFMIGWIVAMAVND